MNASKEHSTIRVLNGLEVLIDASQTRRSAFISHASMNECGCAHSWCGFPQIQGVIPHAAQIETKLSN